MIMIIDCGIVSLVLIHTDDPEELDVHNMYEQKGYEHAHVHKSPTIVSQPRISIKISNLQ